MLGRLRMSVNQAIDNFIDFGNTVFGRPRLFHHRSSYFTPRAKYPAANVHRALQKIISDGTYRESGILTGSGWDLAGNKAIFQEDGGGIRTIVISCPFKGEVARAHIWKSYDHKQHTRIWEVASATSANPYYFDPIKIDGVEYLNGSLVANNPSYRALDEVLAIHGKIPVAFVNIGTGTTDGNDADFRSDTKWRDRHWRSRFQQPNRAFLGIVTEFDADSETERWLELARDKGLKEAYRLSAGKELQAIPYDYWQPAGTGKRTLQEITDITNEYLNTDGVRETISRIAREAVRIRRARARTEQWKDFI
ncbi:hypothetical protein H9Q73_004167 [Fusarium xylarioides]|nr:hypothetical protein H9Q73_004167 [Fusarium xylarioides]